MIVIVDSGGANINSLLFAIERLGKKAVFTADPECIQKASHVILPGVASALGSMQKVKKFKLGEILHTLTQPVLGICSGMQLLYEYSEEGNCSCLGIIPGEIKKLPEKSDIRIPHIGWNTIEFNHGSPILRDISNQSAVYFVHSFYADISQYTLATTEYGKSFSAIIQYQNYFGVQFHPERSGKIGSLILNNFLEC